MTNRRKQERFLGLLQPRLEDLSRFCMAMTGERESARDLMSDVILAAWERFDALREEKAFLSYLFTIARRTWNRRRRRARLFGDYDDERAQSIPSSGTPVWIGADIQALYRALAKLPDAQREALVLFEISGLSIKEVCEVQNASLSAVKSRISRGRSKLADLLGVGSEFEIEGSQLNHPDLGQSDLEAVGNSLLSPS
jgi:RNA polymerase sigma-70 factor (ECF subfamily)